MKKRILRIISLFFVFVLFHSPINSVAFDAHEHDAYLREVLLGDKAVKNTDVMDALNDASALAIDQHNGGSQKTLDELRKLGIKGIPKKVKEFNVGHGAQHRNYTHKGWDYEYEEYKDEAKWVKVRKNILLKTVNQSFEFGVTSGKLFFDYDDQCKGMAALIYYVHIIGDHISNENYNSTYEEIPLVKGTGDYGIIEDLEKYSELLFTDHDSRNYKEFIYELEELKESIEDIYDSPSDLEDPEVYKQYREYAEDLMNILKDYVPGLLEKEKFFSDVFC